MVALLRSVVKQSASYTVKMSVPSAVLAKLRRIPGLTLIQEVPLSEYTRFGLGGRAEVLAESGSPKSFLAAIQAVRAPLCPSVVIGAGTNLIVSDAGFRGVVLRFTGSGVTLSGETLRAEAGAVLQHVVDLSITRGLSGIDCMTGIPGWVGGAVYGNAGAYGQSIDERVRYVEFTDGKIIRRFSKAHCEFGYRESIFKRHKNWIILAVELELSAGDAEQLARAAAGIRATRDAKYPPAMKCAGSIFKNCLFASLPAQVQAQVPEGLVRGGKVPSAWFLEQAGAKGLRRGDIQVASYHANLIYNDGAGTAADLVALIRRLKALVADRFRFELEEEVQYVGFEAAGSGL
jgi:UDP-N-acetylmuramate dehydrogenase